MKQRSFKLLLIMLSCMIGNVAFGYDFSATYNGKTIYYNITSHTDKTVAVTEGTPTAYFQYTGRISIPNEVSNGVSTYTVTSIERSAFSYSPNLTSVSLPSSITSIEDNTFDHCTGLTSIIIPNSVTSIGDKAFYGCTSLNSLSFGNGVLSIGNEAFRECSCLSLVSIPNSVKSIGQRAFYNCKGLISVNIPNSVIAIEESTFQYCIGLVSMTIPNNVNSIGESAFWGCTGLTSLIIEDGVQSLGNNSFRECSNLTSLNIGNGVISIGDHAFRDCKKLPTVVIPNSVRTIGDYAFDTCDNLTSLTIGNNVSSIGACAFWYCNSLPTIIIPKSVTSIGRQAIPTRLSSIIVEDGNTVYDSRNDCNAIIVTATNTLIFGCKNTIIPNSVTSIANQAFENRIGLTSVVIPQSVTSLGEWAFGGCTGMTSVIIPENLTSISDYAFIYCYKLSDIHWTPNAEIDLSSALISAELTGNTRTLYLYKNARNANIVNNLLSTLNGKFMNIVVVYDYDDFDLIVSDAGMSTLYLDYPVSIPDDDNLLGVFYVYQIDGNIMLLKRLKDNIPANNGVIIMANPGTFTFPSTGGGVAEITDNQLLGVTKNTPVSSIDGTVYTLGRGINSGYFGFHKYTGANIPANKAFLVRNASSGINSFNLVLDNGDGTSTAIGRIENGELIPENNVVYDLQGRRVENPSKGIYIVNGKKQYIK